MKSRLLDASDGDAVGMGCPPFLILFQIIVAGKEFANMRKRGLSRGRDVLPTFEVYEVCRRGGDMETMKPVYMRSRSGPPFSRASVGHRGFERPMFYYKVNIIDAR
jgi:hypothetical protein